MTQPLSVTRRNPAGYVYDGSWRNASSWASALRRHLPITLLFGLLAIVMTYPLITHLSKAIPGWEGDNLYYVWQMWWMKHALLDLHAAPFIDPLAYFPVGYQVANGELTPANSVLFLPVTALWGPVAGYNVALLFSFFASAVGAYLWVYQVTKRRLAAVIAALIFAYLPYRFAHLPGHLELMSTQWIPLTLFALERFFANRRWRWAVAAGLFLALVALSSWYYAYAALLLVPIYVLVRAWSLRLSWRMPGWWAGLAIAGLVALVLVLPFALPYYHLAAAGQIQRDVSHMEYWSLNPYDFFIPNLRHPRWAGILHAIFPLQSDQWNERQIGLGCVASVLALVGWWRARRASWTTLLVVLWVVSYLIALGPTLHFADRQITLPSGAPIPLPSYALFHLVPSTSGMRVMIRFGLWTGLMTGALAGVGAVSIIDGLRGRFRTSSAAPAAVLALGIATLILFESYTRIDEKVWLAPRPVDERLAAQSPCSVVVELPLEQTTRPIQNFYTTVNQQCTVLGPQGDSFDAPIRTERLAALKDFPSANSLAVLKQAQTRYVLFTPSQIKDWDRYRQTIEASHALQFQQVIGDVWVYQVE